MKTLDRRKFIKLSAMAGAGVLIPRQIGAVGGMLEQITGALKSLGGNKDVPPPIPGVKFGMVIDMGLCIGCRRCMYACKRENNVPDTISPPWIIVFETESKIGIEGHYVTPERPSEGTTMMYTKVRRDKWYMPTQCNHCDNAPCVKVCPTGASYKDVDGLVVIDYNKCIGCRDCMTACPYNARRFNWWKSEIPPDRINPLVPIRHHGIVEKCTFCIHRTRRGKPTRCVEVCPNRARVFGNLNDPAREISRLIFSERNFRLKERLNTEPRIWYLTRSKEKPMVWTTPLPPPERVRGVKS